jgi:hypothetical protein
LIRRTGAALLLAVSLVAAATIPAAAGLADRVGATFAVMADEFVKAFQPVEGVVLDGDRDILYLDLGETAGAQVGQELTVFRKGDTFFHPMTGRPLGRYEEVLGYVQIRRVNPRFSEATFFAVADKPAPRPEDGVRITRGRIKVAVTPMLDLTASKVDVRRVPFLFASILERSKRFQVIDPLAVSDALANRSLRVEEVLARPERARPVARSLEVTAWVVPVLIERGGVTYLDATWISAITGTALFSRRQALQPPGTAEEQRFPWEPRVED